MTVTNQITLNWNTEFRRLKSFINRDGDLKFAIFDKDCEIILSYKNSFEEWKKELKRIMIRENHLSNMLGDDDEDWY